MTYAKEWRALDHCDDDKNNADIEQEADQVKSEKQFSDEWIIIKDSEGVEVTSTDTQAAISLQIGIQVAIAVVLSITIADSERSDDVLQDFKQVIKVKQSNRQKTIVEKSKNVSITTTDTDIAINIQLLIQVLVAIVVSLDIL
ncbi:MULTISPECIES: spore coat protein [Oceanobacillus]|uniref:Spore coat protein X n=1 Tax=Oceanobacillus kimchii TaxID=746691 RepID=A0ABQ5TFD5_9BACI|nr:MULTISPECIES: spore coat protein [Oceanobacillus]MBT2652833.1 spore coat protein [Oceanobacillus sp. ISL-73]MCT1577377.1 spore coat protein [Oceanobacillus kimchii]MCT2136983.1 spore coat protein [Oceanobacillus kimchii]OEH53580.1 spore coat protein [Oceanobacillus sp. E9]GLO64906.1 spore coat protein X [Oceanobacillus kimchii]